MATTAADVMGMLKEHDVKFVDFRFADTRGKEQHVTVPISAFDEDKFADGHAFDGSSIAGWKGIEASDMLLMPDPNTANIDPFFEESTLYMQCDVVNRTGKTTTATAFGVKRAILTGLGDTAEAREPRFLCLTACAGRKHTMGNFYKIDSDEALVNRGIHGRGSSHAHRPTVKGLPVPPCWTAMPQICVPRWLCARAPWHSVGCFHHSGRQANRKSAHQVRHANADWTRRT